MTLEYELEEEDYFAYYYYTFIKSGKLKKKSWPRWAVAVIYIVLGLWSGFQSEDLTLCFIYIGVAVAWYMLYPFYLKRHSIKFYKEHAKTNYQNRHSLIIVELKDESLLSTDFTGETKILYTAITEITELPTIFLIKIKTTDCVIISKSKIKELQELTVFLKNLANRLSIPYTADLTFRLP